MEKEMIFFFVFVLFSFCSFEIVGREILGKEILEYGWSVWAREASESLGFT